MPDTQQENDQLIHLTCQRYGTMATFGDEDEAWQSGWRKDRNGNWYSPEALDCNAGAFCCYCDEYINFDNDDYMSNIDDDGEVYHRECAEDHGAYYCHRCDCYHWNDNSTEERVLVHYEDYTDEQWWCNDCANEDAEWNDEEDVYEYWPPRRNREEQNPYVHYHPEGWQDECCEECRKKGNLRGTCDKCLEIQKKNKELEETTLWPYDERVSVRGFYHPRDHVNFKKTFYRDKNENPYLYYGIEVEVGFDQALTTQQVIEVAVEMVKRGKGLFVCESDSSVVNGVEFISRPMTYKKATAPETVAIMRDMFGYAKEHGALIEQPKGNGIHIHMSRKFFERNTKKTIDQINRDLDWVFQYYQPEIEKIAQREYTRYCYSKIDNMKTRLANNAGIRYFDGFSNIKITGKMEPTYIVDGQAEHHAVIAMRDQTIEVRCFKSTIDVDTIISYIEFVRNIAHTVRNKSIKKMTLKDIISSKDSPSLDKYIWNLERKGLKTDRQVKPSMKYEVSQQELMDLINSPF